MPMTISIIVAIDENYAIGKDNDLLWHISGDLKRVKKLTTGNVIIMGRNTYLSLPKRPLPNRINMVITDKQGEIFNDCVMAYSFKEALDKMSNTKENFIFGGASVYKQFFPLATKLYLTKVHKSYNADVFFPEIDYSKWDIESKEDFLNNDPPYSYEVYNRIK